MPTRTVIGDVRNGDKSHLENDHSTAGRAFARATVAVFFIMLGVRVLGFVEKQIIAYYFGASSSVDALFVAFGASMTVYLLVREVVEPSFLPVFSGFLEQNQAGRARRLLFHASVVLAILVIPVCVLSIVFSTPLATVLAPGFEPDALEQTSAMLRFTMACAIFMSLGMMTYSSLNAHRRFAYPAMGDLIYRSAPLLLVIAFAAQAGPLTLAIGTLIGSFGRWGLHLVGLAGFFRKKFENVMPSRTDLKQMALLAAPILLGAVFTQIGSLADNYYASQAGPGGVAARTFAYKIIDLPLSLVPQVLRLVVFPFFVTLAAQNKNVPLRELLADSSRGLAMAFAFLTVASMYLARPIVALLLERGAFDASATALTAAPLRWYALGFIGFALEPIVIAFYFAKKDTRTPVIIGVITIIIGIALSKLLVGPFGVSGVAIADIIARTIRLIALVLCLGRVGIRVSFIPIIASGARLSLVCAVTLASMVVTDMVLPDFGTGLIGYLVYLTVLSFVGLLFFLASIFVTPTPERTLFFRIIQRIVQSIRPE